MNTMETKVKRLTPQGEPRETIAIKLTLTPTEISFAKETIPLEKVGHVGVIKDQVTIVVPYDSGGAKHHRLQVCTFTGAKKKAAELKQQIDRLRSAALMKKKVDELTAAGRQNEISVVQCVHCQAFIDLTGLGEGKQVHCEFCPAIFEKDQAADAAGRDYYFCPGCNLFSHRQEYFTMKLVCLVFFASWSEHRDRLCPACARETAKKAAWYCALASTVLAPIMIPVNLAALFKARRAADRASAPEFAGLDKANALAIAGEYDQALAAYQEVPAAKDGHAGILANMALVTAEAGRLEEAAALLEKSIANCPNLWPSYEILAKMYDELKQPEKAQALRQRLEKFHAGGEAAGEARE